MTGDAAWSPAWPLWPCTLASNKPARLAWRGAPAPGLAFPHCWCCPCLPFRPCAARPPTPPHPPTSQTLTHSRPANWLQSHTTGSIHVTFECIWITHGVWAQGGRARGRGAQAASLAWVAGGLHTWDSTAPAHQCTECIPSLGSARPPTQCASAYVHPHQARHSPNPPTPAPTQSARPAGPAQIAHSVSLCASVCVCPLPALPGCQCAPPALRCSPPRTASVCNYQRSLAGHGVMRALYLLWQCVQAMQTGRQYQCPYIKS